MNTYKTLIYFLVLSCLFVILHACKSNKPQYGRSILRKDFDTVALQKKIAHIRRISNDLFDSASFTSRENIQIKYRLLKPAVYTSAEAKYPLVLVFHGSGAIGGDNKSQLGVLTKIWAMPDIKYKYPAYVLAPQFPSRSSSYIMDSSRNVLGSKPQPCFYAVLELIDSLKGGLNIDQTRIYAVGFSMGGSTVINALSARPDLFAAGVSIAGIPQFDSIQSLSSIPIWLIHGNTDTENPFNSDEQFYKEVNTKNKTRFWEFENTAHQDIFSTILLGENIPKWLFSQHKE